MPNNNIPYDLSDHILEKYFRAIGEFQGWHDCDEVAVAVSGGGDSIALLWLFRSFFDGKITAVHVNHSIRGEEADKDEKFTEKFARKIGVSFVSVKVDVPSSKLKGESTETTARRLRLKALAETAKSIGADAVMLGHNRDDLAETILFNLIRGTGIRGSVGMTEKSEHDGVTFYRPLLGLRRELLRDVLRVRGLKWRDDSSNNDDSYTRNFIRLKLLPLIEENINSSAVEHIARFGEDMRPLRESEDNIGVFLTDTVLVDQRTLDRKELSSYDIGELVLVFREMGRRLKLRTLSRNRCRELCRLIISKKSPFIFQWQKNCTVKGGKGVVFFDDHS